MTLMTSLRESPSLCEPRWATARNLDNKTYGHAVAKVAEKLGTPLMPWQRYVADVALEVNPETDRLKYRTVVITVPRQSGKTTLLLSLMVHRALGFLERQNIVYTAQTQKAARKKWEEEHVQALNGSAFKGLYKVRYGMGTEQIVWNNGSRHSLTAPTEKAGHGETLDQATIDEAFAQEDNRLEQALRPAMVTRPQPQLYIVSTAGTAKSIYLKEKVDLGRARIDGGVDGSVAYFEWSATNEDDPADPETWRRCMPALGHTVSLEAIQADFEDMKLAEFRRAYLNQWSDEIPELWLVVSEQDWLGLESPESFIPKGNPIAFGLDFTPERSFGTIVAAGINQFGKLHVEITGSEGSGYIDHRPGTAWMAPRMAELARKWNPCAVVIQANSPAGSLIPDLMARGVKELRIQTPNATEYAGACGAIYDKIFNGQIAHVGQHPFLVALAGAQKMDLGEGAWKWNRKAVTVDISPLVSMTLASWGISKFGHVKPVQPWIAWG